MLRLLLLKRPAQFSVDPSPHLIVAGVACRTGLTWPVPGAQCPAWWAAWALLRNAAPALLPWLRPTCDWEQHLIPSLLDGLPQLWCQFLPIAPRLTFTHLQ